MSDMAIFHQLTNGFVVSDETTVPELMAISPFKGIYRAATAVTMLSKRIVLFAPFDT
jgi:hypothetical protein